MCLTHKQKYILQKKAVRIRNLKKISNIIPIATSGKILKPTELHKLETAH